MKIMVTGNMGYVGPAVVTMLRESFRTATLVGCDTGYFAHNLTGPDTLPEAKLDQQLYADVRWPSADLFACTDTVVHLAAISNDPMGTAFEKVTLDVNHHATLQLATMAKRAGVKRFVFASSCSIYGDAGHRPRNEDCQVNPLTAYARSKHFAEQGLMSLADQTFLVTCLRFATACGSSDRLRLDLVLNDFVASALSTGAITVLSDGSPWRPLINVKDMARAIHWALVRDDTPRFLAVNAGRNDWNYQIKELAHSVAAGIPGVDVRIAPKAQPDRRSYQVDFSLFERLAPDHLPKETLASTINALVGLLSRIRFTDQHFRQSNLMRLKALQDHRDCGRLDGDLRWTWGG